MKQIVIGTAGHVDHGKTELVKTLTGINTDRLEEERKRGMTIELGFAPFDLPDGTRVSIVDVPGHERFVKTMVAGATGMDFVVLVIAADEGVMPQTKEHLDILSLLGVDLGIVAITKCDLVDQEWLQVVMEDIHEVLQHTSLARAPMIPVSSKTKEGIPILLKAIESVGLQARQKEAPGLFRLNIDRAFTIAGHGTVVTGTALGGKIEKGDLIQILPSGKKTKVRGIQVHGGFVEQGFGGDRCALNLMGIEKSEVERGNVILHPDIIKPTLRIDAFIQTISEIGTIKHNQRVHIHIGTQEVLGRIRVIGQDIIPAGQKAYVQIRFESPMVGIRGDRFIIRSYSPVRTIAGGEILLYDVPNRSRSSDETLEVLTIEAKGSDKQLIYTVLNQSYRMQSIYDLWTTLFVNQDELKECLNDLVQSGQVVYYESIDKYISIQILDQYIDLIKKAFQQLSKKSSFRFWMDKEEMKSKVFSSLDQKEYGALLQYFLEHHLVVQKGNWIILGDNEKIKDIWNKKEVQLIQKIYLEVGMSPKKPKQIAEENGMSITAVEEIIGFLKMIGVLVQLEEELVIHKDHFEESVEQIRRMFSKQEKITVGEVRDVLGCGRKNVILFMEYLDQVGVTNRSENERYPGPNLEIRNKDLEIELLKTREVLQTTLEEVETSNEEFSLLMKN